MLTEPADLTAQLRKNSILRLTGEPPVISKSLCGHIKNSSAMLGSTHGLFKLSATGVNNFALLVADTLFLMVGDFVC